MNTQAKLIEKEKNVLKLEEAALQELIFKYRSALNALKVEELTLTNKLGHSLDMARKSAQNTNDNTTDIRNLTSPVAIPSTSNTAGTSFGNILEEASEIDISTFDS